MLHAIMPVIYPTTTLKERVNVIKTVRSTNYAKGILAYLKIFSLSSSLSSSLRDPVYRNRIRFLSYYVALALCQKIKIGISNFLFRGIFN